MSQYPTAVPSFSARSAGEVIQPAHINGLQDEIVALAGGLKNGLEHGVIVSTGGLTVSTGSVNIGGPSSLATMQVNGGSTFAGAATFSTTVTFNGPVTGITHPRVRVGISAVQDIAANAWVGVNWDTEVYDSDGMHSTVTNSSRLTFAGSTGVYHIGVALDWRNVTASTGMVKARIVLNDSTSDVISALALHGGNVINESTENGMMMLSGDYLIDETTDYVTVQVFTRTSTRALIPAGGGVTAMWAHRVSA